VEKALDLPTGGGELSLLLRIIINIVTIGSDPGNKIDGWRAIAR
jgi:hypothetical protein